MDVYICVYIDIDKDIDIYRYRQTDRQTDRWICTNIAKKNACIGTTSVYKYILIYFMRSIHRCIYDINVCAWVKFVNDKKTQETQAW